MTHNKQFKINEELCTQCGSCARDCVMGIIEMNPGPNIPSEKESLCLKCQHCLAVCPTGALSILGKDPANSLTLSQKKPTPEEMESLIKNRRSIRHYKQVNVDAELIHSLLDTASYAPTGENGNSVNFSVVDNIETMHKLRDITYNAILRAGEENRVPENLKFILDFTRLAKNSATDILFRNAPHILIAHAPQDCPSPKEDTLIALSYFELLAVANGLGTLWDGMFKLALEFVVPELKEKFGIPENHLIGYAMVFGKPAIKYARTTQSEGTHIHTIQV